MLEIPESRIISSQAASILAGKLITRVIPGTSPHKFAFYNGDPAEYPGLLTGRKITSSKGHGMFVDICCDNDITITISDGTNLRYLNPSELTPAKHQMLAEFDDGSSIVFSVAMYGGIWVYRGDLDNRYHRGSLASIPPNEDAFDQEIFENIFNSTAKDLSLKALLATEQRIPGVGNGVLQDILFNAGLHPKKKKSSMTEIQKSDLFHSLKSTLAEMIEKGGRDTEKDLLGNYGGYRTILSRNSVNNPCINCGSKIVKENYMGGAIYYCPSCQPL